MSSYKEELKTAIRQLEDNNIAEASLDAWYMLAHITKWNRAEYFIHQDNVMPDEEKGLFSTMVAERKKHVPLQYILKEQEFMGLTFYVNSEVLIPRQDTEILVEEVLKVSKGKSVLDVCTGSGCIIISLAKLGELSQAVAVDISEGALRIAQKNANNHNVKVNFIKSDMFEEIDETFDIIVSNPPYIKTSEIAKLMPEVKNYEPQLALDGKEDGLKFYRNLAENASRYLNKEGIVFFEIGCEQAKDVCTLLMENGYHNIKVVKDYAGLDRVIAASYQHKEWNKTVTEENNV